jgi:hypothetical protein
MIRHAKIRASRCGNQDEKVSALPSDELLLQPWFLTSQRARAIRALIPADYRRKMGYFFDDHGCMICGEGTVHRAHGMCENCVSRVKRQIKQSVKRRLQGKSRPRFDLGLRQAKLAKRLLGRFSRGGRAVSQRRRIETAQSNNPVDEALGPRPD